MVTLTLAALLGLQTLRLEAEDATLKSVSIAKEGTATYVTGITAQDAAISWTANAKAGLYRAKVGFRTPGGPKGFQVIVNDAKFDGMFPGTGQKFSVYDAGLVELKEGKNEFGIGRGWGYYDIDFLELAPAQPILAPKPVQPNLVNRKSTPEAKRLMALLAKNYGKAILSGTYGETEDDFLLKATGSRAAILGGDLMDYSPSRIPFGADPKGHVEKMIVAGKKGQIVTLSWHWNAPKDLIDDKIKDAQGRETDRSWYRGFYTNATTFDLKAALADPQSEGYKLLIRDIDAIAIQLKKFQDAKVPVLWRPLHEAEGAWFWWGAKGPEPCKELWRILYERLTHHHKLNNLIWVWNSEKEDWYPGDETVDIVTIDSYPADRRDPLSRTYENLLQRFDGRKILAVAEFPGVMDAERMFRFGARWAYFVSWTGDLGPQKSDPALLKSTMGSRLVISQKQLRR